MIVIVREVKTKGLLGIFWGTAEEIWDAVDSQTDPPLCEWARLPRAGGLHVIGDGYGPAVVDPKFDEDGEVIGQDRPDFPPLDWAWEVAGALELDKMKWRRFDCADEGVGLMVRIDAELARKRPG